jgi:CRP-like cAMP-binding protein
MIPVETLLRYGAVLRKYTAEELVTREDEPCVYYHQLVDGRLKAINVLDSGVEILQYFVLPGESFAEIGNFDDDPYPVTVTALEPSTVVRIRKEQFQQLLTCQPEFYPSLLFRLSQRLRFRLFVMKEVGRHDPASCIYNLLTYFKKYQVNYCDKCHKVLLTRQQIADFLGLRVETVIRAVRHLSVQGKLKIQKGKVFWLPDAIISKQHATTSCSGFSTI